jgi:hypothetical protein
MFVVSPGKWLFETQTVEYDVHRIVTRVRCNRFRQFLVAESDHENVGRAGFAKVDDRSLARKADSHFTTGALLQLPRFREEPRVSHFGTT